MKHLLIILSFLLLYSPVIGDNHKVETLYLWETSSGTVWKGYGDKEFQDYYVGEWKNGKPNGLGVMIYTNYKSKYQFIVKRKGKYIGEWKEGKWNGQGIHKNKFQDTFVGEFRNDIYWEEHYIPLKERLKVSLRMVKEHWKIRPKDMWGNIRME